MKRQILISSLILLCIASLAAAKTTANDLPYRAGELIVRFDEPAETTTGLKQKGLQQAAQRAAIRQAILSRAGGGSVVRMVNRKVSGLGLVKLPPGLSVRDAVAAYNKTPGILYAEPNYKRKLCLPLIPDDLRFNDQWNLNNTRPGATFDADIDAPEAWGLNPDEGYTVGGKYLITVAVLDTGIDYEHPDLEGNRWINTTEDIGEDNVDDDGNGYVDDIYGYDFAGAVADDLLDADADPIDTHYHGTHVAGIIAADGNNSVGITGVCWEAKVMAVKIFADDGDAAFDSEIVEAIYYAVDNDAKVINASWGGPGYSLTLQNAIQYAANAGVLFVAAAGNESSDNDASPFYPASYNLSNIISVMATDQYDHTAYYSNYGAASVDIAAPGGDTRNLNREGILSLLPTETTEAMTADEIPTSYGYLQGTSMAAPHVSGAVALMMSTRMSDGIPIVLGDIKKMLLRGADRLPDLRGRCVSDGRLNLYNALDMTIGTGPHGAGKVINTAAPATLYDTIQDAINAASNGHTLIANANHWYLENINFNGKQITIRSGDIDVPGYGSISPQNTYITGLLNSGYAAKLDSGETAATILKGFTVTDGHAGGIHILGSSPTITNCIISENTGAGGIYCLNAPSPTITNCGIIDNSGDYAVFCYNSSPTITACTISDNTTSHEGGGIHCDNSSSPIITGCTIADNTTNMDGGGIYCADGSDANITGTTISGNTAGYGGGGIYCINSSPTIGSGTIITGNTAGYEGGGIHCDSIGANPTITDCEITNNTADSEGGGIFCYNGAEPNILNTTLSGNAGRYWGGGIGCYEASPRIRNCLIINNSADIYDGGAISLYDASPTITNSTIVGNSANSTSGFCGGIMCDYLSTPTVTDCIFRDNENYAIATDDDGSEPALTYCLFHDNADGDYAVYDAASYAVIAAYTGATQINGLSNASNNIDGDPQFVPGRLGNYYLSHTAAGQFIDSNAIDAGSATAASLGMDIYSTRTDNVNDSNGSIVDIGYHYYDPQPAVDYNLAIIVVPTGSASSPVPGTTYHKQYAHILLKAVPEADYQFKVWKDGGANVSTEPNYIVILSSNKTITAEFETIMVRLITGVDPAGETGIILPVTHRPIYYPRSTVVNLTATPDNPSHVIIWRGTDDDYSELRSNTVTMLPPFETDPYGQQLKRVEVEFYASQILYFGSDGSYSTLQAAIDAAHDRDIIQIAPANEPYISSWGYEIVGKAITITSTNPDDPCCVAATVFEKNVGEQGIGRMAFYFEDVGRNTILNGITIRRYGGRGLDGHEGEPGELHYDGWPGGDVAGSAIQCASASPTIKNCVIADCNLVAGDGGAGANGDTDHPNGGNGGWPGMAYGGALYCSFGSNPTVINTTFRNNAAIGGNGGDGGNGLTSEPYGEGGRGGGWYYPYPIPSPWEDSYDTTDPGKYTGRGGAVYVGPGSSIKLTGCTFTGNRSEGGTNGICGQHGDVPNLRDEPSLHWKIENFGGAAYCAAGSSAKFEKCSFLDNIADPNRPMADPNDPDSYGNKSSLISYGGGVAYEDGAEVSFEDCTFSGNFACVGGAIQGDWADMLQIDESSFISNSAYHGAGVLFVGGTAKIARSNFSTNEANGLNAQGGAISCLGANALIVDCNISNNNALGSGGGIYISSKDIYGDDIDDGNTVLVKNCLLTRNSAKNDGGGISANWYSDPTVTNCTITQNTVSDGNGGGLSCSYGNYTKILNSIFWGNSAGAGNQIAVGTSYAYDPRPSTVDVNNSDVQGGAALISVSTGSPYTQGDDSILNWDYLTNLPRGDAGNPNPQFVNGYYLSQPAAGQTLLSPCVDAGNTDAHSADMYRHTTRTDGLLDAGTVDMGYHYILDTGLVGDFDYDFVVNFADLPRFLMHWLDEGCLFPDWCHEKDLNQDGVVNFIDQAIFTANYGETETTPPVPNPMTWAAAPASAGPSSITMTATTAYDNSTGPDVEYYFECLSAGGHNRSWDPSPAYTDTGLVTGNIYGYKVKARDTAANQNETAWSAVGYAIAGDDTTAPLPNPSTWDTPPYATSPNSIRMVATTAADVSGVEYYFENMLYGNSSDWQDSPVYEDVNLMSDMTYTYRVRTRDKSYNQNLGQYSEQASATTSEVGPPPDTNAPSPVIWEVPPYETGSGLNAYANMTAAEAIDAEGNGVQYYFECSDMPGTFYSGWQTDRQWIVYVGRANQGLKFRFRVRDDFGNESGWSTSWPSYPPF